MASGRQHVNGVDLYYEQTGRGKHAVLLIPGALGKYNIHPLNVRDFIMRSLFHLSFENHFALFFTTGSTRTDFAPQLKSLNKEHFTVVGWDPRGYGQSRPPDRDFPSDFFERDARDAVDLMKVGLVISSAHHDLYEPEVKREICVNIQSHKDKQSYISVWHFLPPDLDYYCIDLHQTVQTLDPNIKNMSDLLR